MRIPKLEMHLAHHCNLRCAGCSHFSNYRGGAAVTFAQGGPWIEAWAARVEPIHFTFLGGEPLLNPELPQFLRLAHSVWPFSNLRLTSNGLLLDRWGAPLWEVLAETNTRLTISIHSREPRYLELLEPRLVHASAEAKAYGVHYETRDSVNGWYRLYRGTGRDMLPFDDGNPKASWNACENKHCVTLQDNALWKCPPVAHLRRIAKAFELDRIPAWRTALHYVPLSLSATDDEIRAFIAGREEAVCGMCPAQLEYFEKTVF
ncbi:radical SAM protein [Pseudoduganella sp. HUAS MS19]